jgi:hypothetical protein
MELIVTLNTPDEVQNFYKILTLYADRVRLDTERAEGVDRSPDLTKHPEWPAALEMMEYIEAANDWKEIDRFSPQRTMSGKG